jgi:hypothetical protein
MPLTRLALRTAGKVPAYALRRVRKPSSMPAARWSFKSSASMGSAFSIGSVLSFLSLGSVASFGSILSVGSSGSILSVGSAGSVLSIGSAGSVLSLGSAGHVLSIGEGQHAKDRDGAAGGVTRLAMLAGAGALAAVALGR